MWVILFLSVLGLSVSLERVIFFLSARRRILEFRSIDGGHVDGAEAEIVAGRLIRAEIFEWSRHLSILEMIVRGAPMLGLLGTVLGMVEMFGALNVGGAIDARNVTGGIKEALYTTVAGLCCAVPLLFLHGLLSSVIDKREEDLNRAADLWIREEIGCGGIDDGE
ncbi:MotA/TolQ/ExbB proton channel [Synergistales bacterium]|nr:MotA/TolQ/ExbB proton channel [Synergistales bacterium]